MFTLLFDYITYENIIANEYICNQGLFIHESTMHCFCKINLKRLHFLGLWKTEILTITCIHSETNQNICIPLQFFVDLWQEYYIMAIFTK